MARIFIALLAFRSRPQQSDAAAKTALQSVHTPSLVWNLLTRHYARHHGGSREYKMNGAIVLYLSLTGSRCGAGGAAAFRGETP